MPTTNSWSSSSTSTCLPNLRHASPRRQSTQPAQPNRCSGDFGGGDVDSIQFFVQIGKVGLETMLLQGSRLWRFCLRVSRRKSESRHPTFVRGSDNLAERPICSSRSVA